jgi:thiol-disulfide isomerase/thioredoxin
MFVKSYDPATDVTARAVSLAGETDRNVLLHFYADWCNWCRHLDAAFESCEVLTVLQKHLVLVTIVEDGGPDGDENPGAWELRRELGGATSGVPFLAVLGAGRRL